MAEKRTPRPVKGRIELVGRTESDAAPDVVVHLVSDAGEILATEAVEADGGFALPAADLKRAVRVAIGDASAHIGDRRAFRVYPVDRFTELIEAGPVAISPGRWRPWLRWTRCVSGSVRRCFPKPWIIEAVVAAKARPLTAGPFSVSPSVPQVVPLPFFPRCSPVCNGLVEVYRRRCCCRPIVVFDPRIPEIIERPPIPIPIPLPDPPPIPLPEPGPDPVPWEAIDAVATEGALDTIKIEADRDRAVLEQLSPEDQVAYLNARRYLWCTCGAPTKVGEGTIQADGTFDVCWSEPISLIPVSCHDEYAYVVKQPRFGTLLTIYNGVAANQWFAADSDPVLTSYSPFAVGCKEPVVPGSGPFVALQDLGDTESHRLASPTQDGVFSVGSPMYNSGLLDPVTNPADALGQHRNRNFGGTVRLRYEFTDGMHAVGAVYYRVSVAPANAAGDPAGPLQPLPVPQWKFWDLSTGNDGVLSLGPVTQGGESNLYTIPFDGVAPLAPNDEWHDGQYHALLDTSAHPEGRYLVVVEVFDAGGNRLRPNGASGAGNDTPFTYRRWLAPGTTVPVPYAALAHMVWADNRKAVAEIVDIRKNGSASSAQCQFLTGQALDVVSIGYRAYHEKPDSLPPGFVLRHTLRMRRGLAGPLWSIQQDTGVNVGGPGAVPPHESQATTFQELMKAPPSGLTKCAFSLVLHVVTKTTNGEGHSTVFDDTDQAAFAAELVP